MKVKDLIAALQKQDPEMEACIVQGSCDDILPVLGVHVDKKSDISAGKLIYSDVVIVD